MRRFTITWNFSRTDARADRIYSKKRIPPPFWLHRQILHTVHPCRKAHECQDKRDIDPVNNDGITLIPQAMSIVADEVIDLHRQLVPYGYDEINVNLGCPSGTVVSKKRGSGILAYPDMLDSFLDDLYTKADFPVSIKTRVGFNDDELWPRLIEIYSKYPISELTVHPRVQKDFIKIRRAWMTSPSPCRK